VYEYSRLNTNAVAIGLQDYNDFNVVFHNNVLYTQLYNFIWAYRSQSTAEQARLEVRVFILAIK